MGASPLALYYGYASLWRNAKVALHLKWAIKFEFAMRKWRENDVIPFVYIVIILLASYCQFRFRLNIACWTVERALWFAI